MEHVELDVVADHSSDPDHAIHRLPETSKAANQKPVNPRWTRMASDACRADHRHVLGHVPD